MAKHGKSKAHVLLNFLCKTRTPHADQKISLPLGCVPLMAYICDRRNVFRSDWKTAKEIRSILSIRLISLVFEQQFHVDYCGSSAMLIAVEMVRMHAKEIQYKQIHCYEALRQELVRKLHQQKCELVALQKLRNRRKQLKCAFCAKTYKSNERRNLSLHITRCHST